MRSYLEIFTDIFAIIYSRYIMCTLTVYTIRYISVQHGTINYLNKKNIKKREN